MNMLSIAILSTFLQQDGETVQKGFKKSYIKPLEIYQEAIKIIDSDPRQAVEKFTLILDNDAIEKRECKIRLEESDGGYGKFSDFFPYRHRGLARMKLAPKQDPEAALKTLHGAITDFQESNRSSVRSAIVPPVFRLQTR